MTQNSTLRRLGPAALLGFGLVAFGPVQAVDFGDMMSPGRWFGDTDRERDYQDPYYGPGYGTPYRGPEPHGQQPFGQQWGQQPFGQQPFGQQPPSQQHPSRQPYGAAPFDSPGAAAQRLPEWTDPGVREPSPQAPGMGYGYPDYGVPGRQWGVPSVPDERMQQRMRELEERIEELERRRPEPRRPPARDYRQPEFPPADRGQSEFPPADRGQPEFPPLERERPGFPSVDR